jgi:hypothetical protein
MTSQTWIICQIHLWELKHIIQAIKAFHTTNVHTYKQANGALLVGIDFQSTTMEMHV